MPIYSVYAFKLTPIFLFCQISFIPAIACGTFRFVKRMPVQWFVLPVFFVGACCPVNRLSGRGQSIKTVTYEVAVLEKPTVRLTGHRPLPTRPGTQPAGIWGKSEAEFERALTDFGGEDFSALVLKQAARELGAKQGWALAQNGDNADAVMQIRVENICFCAPDALAEVEVKMALTAVLVESAGGEMLWRDCLDWSFTGLYYNLQQLGQADAALREELLSDLAVRLLGRLAKHLAAEMRPG